MNNHLVDLVAEFYLHQNNQNRQWLGLGLHLVNLFLLIFVTKIKSLHLASKLPRAVAWQIRHRDTHVREQLAIVSVLGIDLLMFRL